MRHFHFKNMKKKFTPWFDVFKQGLSGFSWDPITCKWGAEPEVWDKLIEEKPIASKLRGKSFPFYDKFVEVYGVDRATGENAQTAAEMRAEMRAKKSAPTSVEDVDKLVNENVISLENYVASSLEKQGGSAQKDGNEGEKVQGPLNSNCCGPGANKEWG